MAQHLLLLLLELELIVGLLALLDELLLLFKLFLELLLEALDLFLGQLAGDFDEAGEVRAVAEAVGRSLAPQPAIPSKEQE